MCKRLEAEDFVQSEIYHGIFLCDDCILLVNVDNVIAISNDVAVMDVIVKNLQKKEDIGSFTKYLGNDMQINNDNTMEFKQPFFIEQILKQICQEGKILN